LWTPQKYDGVQELVVSPTRVWLPDIGVQNRLFFAIFTLLHNRTFVDFGLYMSHNFEPRSNS